MENINRIRNLRVYSKVDAIEMAKLLTGKKTLEYNDYLSHRAGYPVYVDMFHMDYLTVSDLGTRLEVNYPNGYSQNIWYDN